MSHKLKNYITFIIGWPLTIIAFVFIGKMIFSNGNMIVSAFRDINLFVLGLSLLCFLGYFFIRAYFWQQLLKAQSHDLSLHDVSYSWAFSEIKRYIPGNIWSVATRIHLFGKQKVPYKTILSTTFYEIQYLTIAGGIISLGASNFILYGLFPKISHGQYIIGGISIVILFGTLLFIFHKAAIPRFGSKFLFLSKRILPPFTAGKQVSFLLMNSAGLLCFGMGTYFSISSFAPLYLPHFLSLVAFFVFSLIIGYLSFITPMGLGVREGIITAGLSKYITPAIAGFAAIFTRLLFILAEIMFTLIVYIWHTHSGRSIERLEKFMLKHKHLLILLTLFLAYIAYFTTASFLRYTNFYTGRFDLGNMDQTVWNTLHGRFFMLTDPNGTQNISRLAFHADFILVLLTPFYALWQDPRMLLLLQTVILACGGIFLYFIAKNVFKSKNIGLLFSFLYFINPAIQFTNLYDFHGVTLATTFLLGAWYFMKKHRFIWMSVFLLLAGITKEEVWVAALFFGVYLFFFEKRKTWGIAIASMSLLIFYILFFKAIPTAKGGQHFALSFYSDFGGSTTEVIKTLITNPSKVMSTVVKPQQLLFLFQLFFPLGFISLFSPLLLLFASADWIVDLLSSGSTFHQIYYQYTAVLTPFIFLSGLYGSYFLFKRFPWLTKKHIAIYVISTSLLAAYFYGPLPGARQATVQMFANPQPNKEIIDNFLMTIPAKFSVASTNNIGSHLSRRQNIYTIPLGIDKADIILFLLNDPFAQPSLKAQKEIVEKMKQDKNYSEVMHLGDFIVFEKRNLYTQKEPVVSRDKLYPLSIPTLQERDFDGGPITIDSIEGTTSAFTKEIVSFPSDGLREHAVLQIPTKNQPLKGFPVIIMNHDYTIPEKYQSSTTDDQIADYFTQEGFIVVKPDFRGNGASESDTKLPQLLAYPIDMLNLFSSMALMPEVNKQQLFLWGRSVGATIALTAIEAQNQNDNFNIPIRGAALWTPFADPYLAFESMKDLFPDQKAPYAQTIAQFKTPRENPLVWKEVSPLYYLDDVTTPIQINQGLMDDIVPYQRSIELYDMLLSYTPLTSLRVYRNEDHSFSHAWKQAAADNVAFFKKFMQ